MDTVVQLQLIQGRFSTDGLRCMVFLEFDLLFCFRLFFILMKDNKNSSLTITERNVVLKIGNYQLSIGDAHQALSCRYCRSQRVELAYSLDDNEPCPRGFPER